MDETCSECDGNEEVDCEECEGSGVDPTNETDTCAECGGLGTVECTACQ